MLGLTSDGSMHYHNSVAGVLGDLGFSRMVGGLEGSGGG
jgi:hypothetical protein